MNKSRLAVSIFFGALFFGGIARADCSTRNQWPVTLANSTTADADKVMQDFNHIRDCGYFTGNVGIGTSNPNSTLYIARSSPVIILQDSSYRSTSNELQSYISFRDNTGYEYGWIGDGSGGINSMGFFAGVNYRLGFYSGGSVALTILPSGNVGIGTTSPGYPLDVNGTIRAANKVPTSDRRLKTDIRLLGASAITKLLALRPVTFRWKAPKDVGMAGIQTGLIAQDVETVFPTAVVTARDAFETKSIKYNELTAILIKAVQEQQREMATLHAENVGLRRYHAIVQHQVRQITDLQRENKRLMRKNEDLFILWRRQSGEFATRLDRLERRRLAKAQ